MSTGGVGQNYAFLVKYNLSSADGNRSICESDGFNAQDVNSIGRADFKCKDTEVLSACCSLIRNAAQRNLPPLLHVLMQNCGFQQKDSITTTNHARIAFEGEGASTWTAVEGLIKI